jgi:archaeal type IV pilus assembly protein PilA
MRSKRENAVSPVVGVMLMLVVVIIIAAVVSAFAGGLATSEKKPLQATITGKYSYSSGILQLTHAGGDELPTQKLIVQIRQNDEDFGGYGSMYKGLAIIANNSLICSVTKKTTCWVDPTTGSNSAYPVFLPGDTVYYNSTLSFETGDTHSVFTAENTVGKSLLVEFDTTDGKLISRSKVMIDP